MTSSVEIMSINIFSKVTHNMILVFYSHQKLEQGQRSHHQAKPEESETNFCPGMCWDNS